MLPIRVVICNTRSNLPIFLYFDTMTIACLIMQSLYSYRILINGTARTVVISGINAQRQFRRDCRHTDKTVDNNETIGRLRKRIVFRTKQSCVSRILGLTVFLPSDVPSQSAPNVMYDIIMHVSVSRACAGYAHTYTPARTHADEHASPVYPLHHQQVFKPPIRARLSLLFNRRCRTKFRLRE